MLWRCYDLTNVQPLIFSSSICTIKQSTSIGSGEKLYFNYHFIYHEKSHRSSHIDTKDDDETNWNMKWYCEISRVLSRAIPHEKPATWIGFHHELSYYTMWEKTKTECDDSMPNESTVRCINAIISRCIHWLSILHFYDAKNKKCDPHLFVWTDSSTSNKDAFRVGRTSSWLMRWIR